MVRGRTKIESLAPNEVVERAKRRLPKKSPGCQDREAPMNVCIQTNCGFLSWNMGWMRTLDRIFVYKNAPDCSIIDSFRS
jgi:hypothetical protein